MKIAIVTDQMVRDLATPDLLYASARDAFIATAHEDGVLLPVAMANTDSWMFGIKGGYIKSADVVGFKFGGYWPRNRELGMAAHCSNTILIDPATGHPTALISAGHLNCLRTAAADAVAVDALAREDAETLCVLGAGHQAAFEIRAIARVRRLKFIKLWNRSRDRAEALIRTLSDLEIDIVAVDREEALSGADIVVTVSASRRPLIAAKEVLPGTHVSAMGADQKGKQELDVTLIRKAKLFADKVEQSTNIGEFQHAFGAGEIDIKDVTPLGKVLAGKSPGRTSPEDITIFDSSGVAYQDILAAHAVLTAATKYGLITYTAL
jgi:ornithine cyclodeaminase/alanine dehydrogenase-like protein (mu-crystallin family)